MVGFASATIVGAFVGNSAATIITRATIIMLPCWFVGWVIGRIAQQTMQDHLQRYTDEHPVPDEQAQPERAEPHAPAHEHAVTTT